MARKCGSCGFPAPDDESKFCNRCGSGIVEEPAEQYPVCASCGATVADEKAQFCDKCGGPVKKSVVCPSCGNPALDESSKFCTRCGATFVPPGTCPKCGTVVADKLAVFCNRCGAPMPGAARPQEPVPTVVVAKKKTALPVDPEPVAEWDPWTDGSPEFDAPPVQEEPRPARRSLTADERPIPKIPQISVPPKKYSHLPLVAEELKGAKAPYTGTIEVPVQPSPEQGKKKKGVLGFLKK